MQLLRRILIGCLASLTLQGAMAADNSVEYGVKGAFLYKLIPFVQWPTSALPSPNAPIAICILGHDPFGATLDKQVADQHADAHPIVLRRIDAPDPSCQAVFVGNADAPTETAMLQAYQGKPVLTVTDSGAPAGGIVSFVIDNNHVRFDIDDAAAARSGLTISSKLLSLARNTKPRGGAL
jgi:hypothetical protein